MCTWGSRRIISFPSSSPPELGTATDHWLPFLLNLPIKDDCGSPAAPPPHPSGLGQQLIVSCPSFSPSLDLGWLWIVGCPSSSSPEPGVVGIISSPPACPLDLGQQWIINCPSTSPPGPRMATDYWPSPCPTDLRLQWIIGCPSFYPLLDLEQLWIIDWPLFTHLDLEQPLIVGHPSFLPPDLGQPHIFGHPSL